MVRLALQMDVTDGDEETTQRLTGLLRTWLLDCDVEGVEFTRRAAAPGTKAGVGELVAGALVVLTTMRPATIRAIVEMVRSFLGRHDGRRVRVRLGEHELAIDGARDKDVSAAVDAFVRAVADAEPVEKP